MFHHRRRIRKKGEGLKRDLLKLCKQLIDLQSNSENCKFLVILVNF